MSSGVRGVWETSLSAEQDSIYQGYQQVWVTIVLQLIEKITKDRCLRLEGYMRNPSLLNEGVFTAPEYCTALSNLKDNHPIEKTRKLAETRLTTFCTRGSFYHGYTSSKSIKRPDSDLSPTGTYMHNFHVKKEALPSVAIDEMIHGLSILRPSEVLILVMYKALATCLGNSKFDFIFQTEGTELEVDVFSCLNPLPTLFTFIEYEDSLKEGDIACFFNPYHSQKHLSEQDFLFAAHTSQNKFVAFGLPPNGLSKHKVLMHLLHEYNRTPLLTSLVTEKLAQKIFAYYSAIQLLAATCLHNSTYSFKEFKSLEGVGISKIWRLNVGLLVTLLRLPPAEAQQKFQEACRLRQYLFSATLVKMRSEYNQESIPLKPPEPLELGLTWEMILNSQEYQSDRAFLESLD